MAQNWRQSYWDWLMASALPVWAENGVDRAQGGFQELLGLDGHPIAAPRRARVQSRQSFVFAYAGTLGWEGPWREVAGLGLEYLDRFYKRPDGLYSTLTGPDGHIIDKTAMTYDQTFAMLAAAALHKHGLGPGEAYALNLLDHIVALRRHSAGGFTEPGPRFLSNPHMHLFEASLSWMEANGTPRWRKLAEEVAELALRFFVDPVQGVLLEHFSSDWSAAMGDAGDIVEPGHLFEWAWLLERWSRLSRDEAAHAAASTLFVSGCRCIDAERGVALDEVGRTLTPRRITARLWPQTEWLKAACILGDHHQAEVAASALWCYLQTPKAGLWRDKMREDGGFVEEPVPASSLYHIICAVASLQDLGPLK